MLPIGDDKTSRKVFPVVTYALIALNFLVFFQELIGILLSSNGLLFPAASLPILPAILRPSLRPCSCMPAGSISGATCCTCGVFGDNVEDWFGHLPYLAFYLLCGVVATFAQLAFSLGSTIPSLGASEAIAGVLGAYIVLFPERRITVLLNYGAVGRVPAIIVIGLWFSCNCSAGLVPLLPPQTRAVSRTCTCRWIRDWSTVYDSFRGEEV